MKKTSVGGGGAGVNGGGRATESSLTRWTVPRHFFLPAATP